MADITHVAVRDAFNTLLHTVNMEYGTASPSALLMAGRKCLA